MQRTEPAEMLAAPAVLLRRLVRTDHDPPVRQRAQALLFMADGESIAATARLLHHSPNCLRAWRTRFLAGGRDGLADRPRRGRPPKLDAAAHDILRRAVERGPEAYGLPVTVWSLRDLQGVLQRDHGITVSVFTVQRTLHALGYRYRRPRHDLAHRQDREAVATVAQVLAWLQKKHAPPDRLRLVCLGECEVHTHPHLAKVWRRRGGVTRIPAAGEDCKFAVFGAVDYASGQVIWQTHARKGEQAFMAFLDQLAATLPPDIPTVIMLDNVGYHKSHALRAYWQRLADRFRPFWLPAYAPQLNRIERVWRYLKEKLSNHRWWNDLERLRGANERLLSLLSVRFHPRDKPSFHLRQAFCSSA